MNFTDHRRLPPRLRRHISLPIPRGDDRRARFPALEFQRANRGRSARSSAIARHRRAKHPPERRADPAASRLRSDGTGKIETKSRCGCGDRYLRGRSSAKVGPRATRDERIEIARFRERTTFPRFAEKESSRAVPTRRHYLCPRRTSQDIPAPLVPGAYYEFTKSLSGEALQSIEAVCCRVTSARFWPHAESQSLACPTPCVPRT